MSNKEIKKFDKNNNLIYKKDSDGHEYWWVYDENNNEIYSKDVDRDGCLFEYWQKYDENSNLIHYKRSFDNYEEWYKYSKNNNLMHYKFSNGFESWYKYDKSNKRIIITEQGYKELEFRKKEKEYNLRTKCSRFELIDI